MPMSLAQALMRCAVSLILCGRRATSTWNSALCPFFSQIPPGGQSQPPSARIFLALAVS